jgi:hypothetical protein
VIVRLLPFIVLCVLPCAADPYEPVFTRLYNFDFAGAHKLLDGHLAERPNDHFAHGIRSSTYLFSELDRLKILESEFFADDKKISGDDKLKPDPQIREKLFAAIDRSQELADARLKESPGDTMALFSFSLTEGVRTDYMAFVEKKQFRSLFAARKSHNHAIELARRDPEFADVHLTFGIGEYLIGSLPFFMKWVVRFDQVKGSKDDAVANLEKTAASGRYLGPFARILLAVIHLREKRPERSIELLDGLVREYPESPLYRKELAKLREKQNKR